MDLKDITSAANYAKTRLEYYEYVKTNNKRLSTKDKGFDKGAHARAIRRIKHYTNIIQALEKVKSEIAKEKQVE